MEIAVSGSSLLERCIYPCYSISRFERHHAPIPFLTWLSSLSWFGFGAVVINRGNCPESGTVRVKGSEQLHEVNMEG
ncbi:uncharacterized protein BP01DRAFT_73579 [Aspergillus saccharolyticus JOP 1030-1]|uniref:Uncharacterized protein n=1 Tax=Aspergillus saccharolyticus JOP 1030-1 TaxID=1450539 RepID=A0A319ASF4_9EURO|nr:hypothetical protein BP01DRAFT_73579 [Aspergillus saccharolyticus JOP 1030-1]PYH49202.1 hypothetical protein BP01DRAFT_73579 [Aspergillus saccharolyticus JOP 1030-1]